MGQSIYFFILPYIRNQKSHLYFNVIWVLNDKVEGVTTRWTYEGELIVIWVLHYKHFFHPICLNYAVNFILIFISVSVVVGCKNDFFHENRQGKGLMHRIYKQLRLKNWLNERIWGHFVNQAVESRSFCLVFEEGNLNCVNTQSQLVEVYNSDPYKVCLLDIDLLLGNVSLLYH